MNKRFLLLLGVAGLTFAACAEQNHPVSTYPPTGPGVADIAVPDQVAVDHSVAAEGGATTGGSANSGAASGGSGGGGGHR